jgi:hypothetical protein
MMSQRFFCLPFFVVLIATLLASTRSEAQAVASLTLAGTNFPTPYDVTSISSPINPNGVPSGATIQEVRYVDVSSRTFTPGVIQAGMRPLPEQAERAAANRIARLAERLDPDRGASLSVDQWESERESTTVAIRAEVTRFIEASVPVAASQQAIEARLRSVLVAQRPDSEYTDPPRVRSVTTRFGRSLVVAYTVVRPPHFDSSLIFGFTESGGRFSLSRTTGEDFDGYTMFSVDVPTPVVGELWLLVGGRAHTFNGSKMRFRLYGFDGVDFRTIWERDDVSRATVRQTVDGFTITHQIREAPYTVDEDYLIAASGVVRLK